MVAGGRDGRRNGPTEGRGKESTLSREVPTGSPVGGTGFKSEATEVR